MKIQLNDDSGFLSFKDEHYGPGDEVEVTDVELKRIVMSGFSTFRKIKTNPIIKEIE